LNFEEAAVLSHVSVEKRNEGRKEGRRASAVNTSLQTSIKKKA
jgi:hypothetical protein